MSKYLTMETHTRVLTTQSFPQITAELTYSINYKLTVASAIIKYSNERLANQGD